ncbi:MAG: DUF4129 domain-containing protein, partial [Ardenticatenaceae bacterium]
KRLRYELLLLATVGFEVVWLSLLTYVVGRDRAGGALGWLPLFLAGTAMLLWNRWLWLRERWEQGAGRLLSLLGGLVVISLLMAAIVPQEASALVAGPRDWLRALTGVLQLFIEPVPLTVVLLVALILWFRTLLITQKPATLQITNARFRSSAIAVALLLVLAATLDLRLPGGMVFIFFGFGLVASALARAHVVAQQSEGTLLALPFNLRWFGALLGAVAATLFLALLATGLFSLRTLGFLWNVLAPVRYALAWLFAGIAFLLALLILPLVEFLFADARPIRLAQPTPQATIVVEQEAAASQGNTALLDFLILLGAILVVATILYYLYQRFQDMRRDADDPEEVQAGYEQGKVVWNPGQWLRRLAETLSIRMAGVPRREFGIETVRDLYKNLLLFGEERSLPRPTEDTPYEYLDPLCQQYPQRRADFHLLTEAYVATHYGKRDFSRNEIEHLQDAWRRIAAEASPPESQST